MRSVVFTGAVCALALTCGVGCVGAEVEPGHRGLFFDPHAGLQHDVLQPGYHRTGSIFRSGRIDDFDVTYSTRKEDVHTTSAEGLSMDLRLAVIFRPIQSELYELDTEIGPQYYDEVIGPEFKSAARGVLAHHSYTELLVKNAKIEDEIEIALRERTHGKHIEITSITMEEINYAPEIAAAVRAKLVGEQEAVRQKAQIEHDHMKRTVEIKDREEEERAESEKQLRAKENQRKIAEADAAIEKMKAETDSVTKVVRAKAEAQEISLLAKAHAEEKRAESTTITPLAVAMHAYDALGKLGGEGTTVMLGDFSKTPKFLFPNGGFYGVGNPYTGGSGGPAAAK